MAKNMQTVKYIDGMDNSFKIWGEEERLSETGNVAKLGVADSLANDPSFPRGARPRAVQVKSGTGIVRWVVCYATTATLWTGVATAITMSPFAGSGVTAVEFTATGIRREEKFRRKAQDLNTV